MTANIDYADVFTPAPQMTEEERKAAWVERRKSEREDTYSLIDNTALRASSDPAMLQTYLNVQSKFDRHSTSNALLIAAQRPTATRFADFERWKDEGVFVKVREKSFVILEPGKEYTRDDGSTGVSYNVKHVFDITQTNAKPQRTESRPDLNACLKALVQASPVQIFVVEEPIDARPVTYVPENNAIAVAKGQEATDIIRGLSQEVAYAALVTRETEPALDPDVASYCASYMVCSKFGVETKGYNFADVVRSFDAMDAKGVREALETVRSAGTDIIGRMLQTLERAKSAAAREASR